ncbi:hypothetical protein NCC49_006555 [Naganishia albida]|nr:hypothetical protein NCC49_006555 [Naganishia albida]
MAPNAEYRRRPSDPCDRPSEDSGTPLLPSVSATGKPASRNHSTSDLGDGKAGRTGSFTNVLESGKKHLARLNSGSGLRGKRAGSPTLRAATAIADLGDPLGDMDGEERKVLLNRTRKLGRVLGETLNEREVGELVVRRSRGGSPVVGGEGMFERHGELQDESASKDVYHEAARLESRPLSPTFKRIRRYSDPTSPGLLSSDESFENEADERVRAKQQRRMRLDKLNRLLGAHVPIGFLGPAVWPSEAREEVDEDAGEQKKRAVKVASKMFSVFREPPPVNACIPGIPRESSEVPVDGGYRSRLKTSVALYHQTIGSIRYLIEHDRRLLHSVMDELDSKPGPEPTDVPSSIRRKRSLSSPTAPISPLPTTEDAETYETFPSLRKRAIKLNSFFGDPRTAGLHIHGGQSRVYEETDRKAKALERLLSDLEEDVREGELAEDELVQIRESILDTRRVVSMHVDL